MIQSLVSIIMPAYNGEQFIRQAIQSVLAQTYPNWELIIVDDGSTDKTAQVISNFADPRIRYVFQENNGQASALNHGLDLVRGEYVTTLDVDDWYTPDSLKDRVEFLERNKQYGVVYGDGIFCDIDGKPLKKFSDLRDREMIGDVYGYIISNSFYGTGANILIRKSVLDKHKIRYDESIVWCQDLDLYIRLAEICLFGFVDTLTMWYRLHSSNMTSSMSWDRRRESLFRTKLKVMSSQRFCTIDDEQKNNFFSGLLLHDLRGLLDKQMEVFQHPNFAALLDRQRAAIMRWVAVKYVYAGKNSIAIRELVSTILALNPFDIKSIFVFFLSRMPSKLLVRILPKYHLEVSIDEMMANRFNRMP